MRRYLICALALSLLSSCFAGCGRSAAEEEPEPARVSQSMFVEAPGLEESPEGEPAEEPEVPAEPRDRMINPFTGEAVEEEILAKRPYLVMVNNIIVAQPQVGISQADMIWELMEEGGITRMMAFFTDMESVEKVGSIRSARWYNVSVTQAFDGIIVHAGGSQEALDYIDWGIDDVDYVRGRYTGGTFYRDPSRQAYGIEHSLFAGGSDVVQSAADMGYRAEHYDGYDVFYGLNFSDAAEEQCTSPASYIRVKYAGGKSTNFTYDEEKGLYTGEQYGSVYADNGEEPLYFKNVIVLNANTELQEDGLHLTIEMEGGGNGYFCCGGMYTPIQWQRDGYEDCFHFSTMDGAPLALGVGKTFVAVQQVGSYVGTTDFVG